MEIKKIFVAGAGLMGGGIAQVCAQAGYRVTMRDISDEILEKSLQAINWSVGKFVEKERPTFGERLRSVGEKARQRKK